MAGKTINAAGISRRSFMQASCLEGRTPAHGCLSGAWGEMSYPTRLLTRGEVRVAVALPALLVGLGTDGPLLAVADGLQLVAGNTQLHQEVLRGRGAAIAQTEVVLG